MVLVEHLGEFFDTKVYKCLFGKFKIEVHKDTAEVEDDVFDGLHGAKIGKQDLANIPGPICF